MRLAGNARPRAEPGKAAYARRLVQVLEFFDAAREASTVNVIAAHHGWPQSSTSDLLAVLVELGLLYKDEDSHFLPTPRAAMLASRTQPPILREGRLAGLMEQLAARTGLGIAVVGKVGRDAQVFGWTEPSGAAGAPRPGRLSSGQKTPLHETAAGWLLLSTLGPVRARAVLHRLRGEAAEERKFSLEALGARVQACARQRHVFGPAGFGAAWDICGVLVPGTPDDQPLVIGLVFDKSRAAPHALVSELQGGLEAWLGADAGASGKAYSARAA